MPQGVIATIPKHQFSANGSPLVGGTLTTYLAGTTTPVATYQDMALTIANTNPITLDARGECVLWLDSAIVYKFVLKDGAGVIQWTQDSISGAASQAAGAFVKGSDLAAVGGAALVGFKQPGAGAVARTVLSKFSETVSVKDFGAVGDGVTADAAAFAAAIASVATTGQAIYVPAGVYKIGTKLATTGNLNMFGDGDSTVLDFSGMSAPSDSGLTVTGALTLLAQTITLAARDGLTVSFSAAPAIASGDVFCLFDSTTLWSGFRAYYFAGEWCEARSTSGSAVKITTPLYDGYIAATARAYKLSSPNVSLRNFKVKGGAGTTGLIKLSMCAGAVLENITTYNEAYQAIELDRCYRVSVVNPNIYNKGTGTLDDYGLLISNSQRVRVRGGDLYARRHGLAVGGGSGTCAVPNRNIRIAGMTISNDSESGIYSADIHGNTQDMVYEGCTIYNGCAWAGADNGYDNCTIYAAFQGWCLYSNEVRGGTLSLRNSRLITSTDPSATTRGIVDVGANNAAITSNTVDALNLVVENCSLTGRGMSALTTFMFVVNSGTAVNVNISITNICASVNAMSSILRTDLNSGTANSTAIVVDAVSGFPDLTKLHTAAGSYYLNKPQRMMRQSGKLGMTASSGTAETINAPIGFRYLYPRTPVAMTGVGGDTGSYSTPSGQNIDSACYTVTNAAIRPSLRSTNNSNWSSTVGTVLNWSVGLDEA